MEIYKIEKDIPVFYLTASSFPEDVPNCYQRLQEKITDKIERRYFGISYPNPQGTIIYKACAEALHEQEADEYGCEKFTIKAGEYISLYIVNHFSDANNIPNAFKELLKEKNIDPNGYCLEVYKNYTDLDVLCLVPLKK